jgi:glycosyltransferase involved in cell wall biosynthesis
MSKIKILAVIPDTFGVGKFRVLDPYKFIGNNYMNEIHVDMTYNMEDKNEAFNGYDIVVFHSFIHQLPHEVNVARIKWLKDQGIKTIMDIDDLWFVDQRHPMFFQIKNEKIGEKKIELLKLVDYVTTTTPIFAQTIKGLGVKNVEIFPNAVDPTDPQYQPNPTPTEKIRFGWLGGSTHEHDLALLSNGISSVLHSNTNDVQFVLCGFDLRGTITEFNPETKQTSKRDVRPEETVWFKYEKMFTDNYKFVDEEYMKFLKRYVDTPYTIDDKQYVRRWTQSIKTYASNYNHFDISLAPLVESKFNANKSQLKVIEAGFHKKAIIASNTEPYTLDLVSAITDGKLNDTGNALLVDEKKGHKDWAKQMKRIIDNPSMVKELGERLYDTVKDKYSLQKVSKDRVEFLKSIVK